ncbi:hypothetical protein CI109_106564 [Kwoniella shandongensis]|uniref:RING-type domain-containing protein n=1 Tax=Kwoniella shandongensis TaxID=1734106 RepID=A0AAJ8MZU5_9TREE
MSIILHQAWFFEGDVRHVQKEVDAEVNCYAQADIVRKEILLKPLQNANKSVELLEHSMTRTAAIHDVMELQTEETDNHGGLLSNDIAAQANDLLEILNDNAVLVFEWRAKILALLSSPIDASAAEPRAPDEVEAYLIAYASAIADRKEFMLESRSLLATHDARVTKQRSTKAAINAVADDTAPPPDVTDEVGEQAAVLMKERQAFRDARQEKGCDRPLKGLLMDLNGSYALMIDKLISQVSFMGQIDLKKSQSPGVWRNCSKTTFTSNLNKELDLLRATFNRRVVYFAALQEISDSVSAPEFKDLQKETQTVSQEINEIEAKLSKLVIKGRYLKYLGEKQDNELDVREDCIICFGSSDDNQAVLLQCGHYFCLSCYKEFRKSPGGRKCPSCRIEIDSKEITRIKLSSASRIVDAEGDERGDVSAQVEGEGMPEDSGEDQESIRRVADLDKLKMMDVDRRREVMLMDMLGEYGSKINFLIKHLLYYKSREPETRHVIFSNWSDSLNIVMQALRLNGIKFSSFEQGKKQKDVVDQFINDKSISVFLLHAERESSGLTLTTCQVVHLLEPVLRHSFELQAIGRVDRLGQDKETTVYCYATMETVEARILSQGVRNGTSIYLDADNADHVVADMPNVVSAAHKGGDVSGDSNEEDLLGLIL